jgi:hypothetical protein
MEKERSSEGGRKPVDKRLLAEKVWEGWGGA